MSVSHEQLTDVAINENKEVEVDATNDLRTVSGEANLRQSVALDVMDVTQSFLGDRMTPTSVNNLRSAIRQSLASDPQIDSVTAVKITDVDSQTNTVTVEIRAEPDHDFELDLSP